LPTATMMVKRETWLGLQLFQATKSTTVSGLAQCKKMHSIPGFPADMMSFWMPSASQGNDAECRTICAGPTPFSYGLVDVYDRRVTCFFNGESAAGETVEFGCSYDVDDGEYKGAVTPGTACSSVSVEHGTCAARRE
jgi:hypothetical protein